MRADPIIDSACFQGQQGIYIERTDVSFLYRVMYTILFGLAGGMECVGRKMGKTRARTNSEVRGEDLRLHTAMHPKR